MKSVLLLVPKMNGPGNGKKWNITWSDDLEHAISKKSYAVITPGILVIAALTDRSAFRVTVVDEEYQSVDATGHYDIVAMYTVTPNYKRATYWANYFKKKGSYIVMGGVHVSVVRDEPDNVANTLIVGEAEYLWPKFLEDFRKGEPKRLYVQTPGSVELRDTPVPGFEYIPEPMQKIIPVQATRGCPHGCRFCNIRQLYGKTYRKKQVDRVTQEIEMALTFATNPVIYFTDDNLFVDKSHTKALLAAIKPLNITWYAHSDISLGEDEELAGEAFRSGCRQLLIGLESANPLNLDGIDQKNFKRNRFSDYPNLIHTIQSNGIGVIGSIILGLDQDNERVFEDTLDFITSSNLYGASLTVNTPYPGTESFEKLAAEHRIMTYDWDQYTIFQPVIEPKNLTIDSLNEGVARLMEQIQSPENTVRKMNYFRNIYRSLPK